MKNHTIYIAAIFVLTTIATTVVMCQRRAAEKDVLYWQKQAQKKDTLLTERDGQYSKMVNTFNRQKDLNNKLENELSEAYNTIRDRNEKILNYQNVVAGFEDRDADTVFLSKADSDHYSFQVQYPDTSSPFITYSGLLRWSTRSLSGRWSFDTLNISIILTQEKDKSWRTRVVGPDFFRVSSIEANSLPPKQYDKPPVLSFLGGAGVGSQLGGNVRYVTLNSGITYRSQWYALLSASSDFRLSLSVLKKF